MMGKTVGALVCVVSVLVLWVVCLRMLLTAAQHDPGAYLIAGFVFVLLPFAVLAFIALMVADRRGYWNRPGADVPHRFADAWRTRGQVTQGPRFSEDPTYAPVKEHEAA